jgi:hypothetical protein
MSTTDLPQPIAAFLKATRDRDSSALLATFAGDAVLTDMGKQHRGQEIARWNDDFYIGANVVVTVISAIQRGQTTSLTVMVDGDYEASRSPTTRSPQWRWPKNSAFPCRLSSRPTSRRRTRSTAMP